MRQINNQKWKMDQAETLQANVTQVQTDIQSK